MKMKPLTECCGEMMNEPDRYTHEKDWSLEQNRPRLGSEYSGMPKTSTESTFESGLVVRQPL